MPMQPTYAECLALLELKGGCTPAEIRKAYQRMVMIWHPDRFPPNSELSLEAEARIKAINEAYRVLRSHPGPPPAGPPPRPPSAAGSRPSPFARCLGYLGALVALGLAGTVAFHAFQDHRPTGLPSAQPAAPREPPRERSPVAPAEGPQHPTTFFAPEGPALVIFLPSDQERDASTGARAGLIEDFLHNANHLRRRLRETRPGLVVKITDADTIAVGGMVLHRNQTTGFGYIIHAPPRAPKVLEGLQRFEDMREDMDTLIPIEGPGAVEEAHDPPPLRTP